MLLGDRPFWADADLRGDDRAVILERVTEAGTSLLGVGDPWRARELLVGRDGAGAVAWLTLPRLGAGPAGAHGEPRHEGAPLPVDDDLSPHLRTALGVEPATAWDWFATDVPPAAAEPEGPALGAGVDGRRAGHAVVRLDPTGDLAAIRDCLAEGNPDSRADPAATGEAAWFGIVDGPRLLGVVGAAERAGDPDRADLSWHVHGLGVRPEARTRGFGARLTAAATRAAFEAGADWASLGMYASNDVARRVYTRLGYRVEGRFTSYRAAVIGA